MNTTTGENTHTNHIPILEAKIFGVPRDRAQLLAIAAQNGRIKGILSATAVAQSLHNWINFLLKQLGQLHEILTINISSSD